MGILHTGEDWITNEAPEECQSVEGKLLSHFFLLRCAISSVTDTLYVKYSNDVDGTILRIFDSAVLLSNKSLPHPFLLVGT